MAHFAKLGVNGKVIAVHGLDNDQLLNADNVEDETVGQQRLQEIHGWPAQMWIQTSYNTSGGVHKDGGTPFRGNYAGIGYTWDEDDQIFWPKKPFASWVKHIESASWKSPIGDAPDLTDAQTAENTAGTHRWSYVWNEANTTWDLTNGLA